MLRASSDILSQEWTQQLDDSLLNDCMLVSRSEEMPRPADLVPDSVIQFILLLQYSLNTSSFI